MTDIMEERPDVGLGSLAGALAKAQSEFGAIARSKTVTVQTKTGGSYKFSYAPLDAILAVVRKPLADHGLAITQLLDDGALTTMLIHESGAQLVGRTALPRTDDIQAFGSAITYLRRYAIQSLLGIAAEEDDDGNRGAGNTTDFSAPIATAAMTRTDDGGLIGHVEAGKDPVDMELRQTPDGGAWGFKLVSGRKGFQALAHGPLAQALSLAGLEIGTRVIVWGPVEMVPWRKGGKDMPPFARINIERVQSPDWTLPAPDHTDEPDPVEAPSAPLFADVEPLDETERALVAGGLPE